MKELISDRQATALITMFIMGSTLVMGGGSESKQDVWIASLISLIMAVPIYIIYSRLLSSFPGKDLFEILRIIFGKFIGKALSLVFAWYAFHLGSLVIRNFSEFMAIVGMNQTPAYISVIFLGFICIWAARDGIEVLGRLAYFILPIVVVILTAVTIFLLPNMHFENFRPMLSQGITPVLDSAFTLFSFPFAEAIIFLMVFKTLQSKKSPYKAYFLALPIGGAITLSIFVRNMLVLGPTMVLNLYFPSFSAVSIINIGDFLQRMEVLVTVVFLSTGFIKISMCLYAASNGLAKVFNLGSHKSLVAPVGLLMMNLSMFIYKNIMEMQSWATDIYKYYAFPFQVILPVVVLIAAEIKIRTSSKKSGQNKNK